MPIHNLTKLTIRLADENDEVYRTLEPGGEPILVRTSGQGLTVDEVPIEQTRITGLEGLPDQQQDVFYVVPQPVAHVLNRADLLVPDTGPSAIRNDDGSVYAVRRLYSVSLDT